MGKGIILRFPHDRPDYPLTCKPQKFIKGRVEFKPDALALRFGLERIFCEVLNSRSNPAGTRPS